MKIRKILVVYKHSIFEKNFKDSVLLKKKNPPVIAAHLQKMFRAHRDHYDSLKKVRFALDQCGIPYVLAGRKDKINFKSFDLVLTVGGDGTFMEVSRQVGDQIVLGINSAPVYSIGRYCRCDALDFPDVFDRLLSGHLKSGFLPRLQLKLDGKIILDYVLNDLLVAHANPAMMSRYGLEIGAKKEEQKSSGVWIATPSGSTGAVKSAGGKVISSRGKKMVYCPRELHQGLNRKYSLKGGVLKTGQSLTVVSMMKNGKIYGDGGLVSAGFPYGSVAEIAFSAHPLKTIQKV